MEAINHMIRHKFVPEKMGVEGSRSQCGFSTDLVHERGERYAGDGEEVTCQRCKDLEGKPVIKFLHCECQMTLHNLTAEDDCRVVHRRVETLGGEFKYQCCECNYVRYSD